jgi:uncharacterized membrane protein YgdD (TMEM256/DUF423 family)
VSGVAARLVQALAPLFCAFGVALAAYSGHAAAAADARRLAIAAAFFFAHGLGLLLVAGRRSRLAAVARWLLLAGVLLFAGSLAGGALWGWPGAAAPWGGSALILGWLLFAVDGLRGGGEPA